MAHNQTTQRLRKKQKIVKEIENTTDPDAKVRIVDYYNADSFVIRRDDIKGFSYSQFDDTSYISFVLPFADDGKPIIYNTYSKRTPQIKSGEILPRFAIDKNTDIYLINGGKQ